MNGWKKFLLTKNELKCTRLFNDITITEGTLIRISGDGWIYGYVAFQSGTYVYYLELNWLGRLLRDYV